MRVNKCSTYTGGDGILEGDTGSIADVGGGGLVGELLREGVEVPCL